MGKLTDISVRNAAPRATRQKLFDGDGLELWVMKDGAKYWKYRFRFDGKRHEMSLGVYPLVSLKDARTAHAKANALRASGINPKEARQSELSKRRKAAINKFADAAEAWFQFREKAWRKRTADQVREYLDKDLLPSLRHRSLDSIQTLELAQLSSKIELRGAPDVAKKVRQWLKQIYEHALANGWTNANPTTYLRALHLPAQAANNYPHLSLAELPAFLRALDAIDASPIVKGAAKLVLWSANRPGVTRTLKWTELDLDAELWTIAEGREGMKRGYFHLTPLPRQAAEMLRELKSLSGTFEYVFYNRNDPRRPISDGSINGLFKRLGYRGRQTAHGFRHLVSTALYGDNYPSDWIERQLAHGDPNKVKGTYNHAHYLDERRKMMQQWADKLDSLKESSTVAILP